ncbi:unnamed protein product [Rotaria sordida]|uniref:Uncharacterized protein n=1 Tax=Rotaria sordida TaxID=392033 RepID=A0A814FJ09_9BILA|nr:unnamed protein product [Rotaria sordida]
MHHRITRLLCPFFEKDEELDRQSLNHYNCMICNLQCFFVNKTQQVRNFYASQIERQKLNINKMTLSTLSSLTIMYILHDCFRSNDHRSIEQKKHSTGIRLTSIWCKTKSHLTNKNEDWSLWK